MFQRVLVLLAMFGALIDEGDAQGKFYINHISFYSFLMFNVL